ncbi:MAG TPA: hypothetical protein VF911_21450, partial [Thermoanaerobaculia bacterium]
MNKRLMIAAVLLMWTSALQAAIHASGRPTSTNNDDSCDIALLPAATLLVPYFEVDLDRPNGAGENTLITVTNVSNVEQIALVTLWTDWAFPVVSFNIYLTGYDVQSIGLYDILALGLIAPPHGTGFEGRGSSEGDFSRKNPLIANDTCYFLPVSVPPFYRARLRDAFTKGTVAALGSNPACGAVGGRHERAIGYATIDVVRRCGIASPIDESYYRDELLFDNVLVGDYQQINGAANYSEGGPLVHIRAIPEGGTAAARIADPQTYQSNFPRTFYSRYQSAAAPALDGRQPLPSQFASHWIAGGAGGFSTDFKIWREGAKLNEAACGTHAVNEHIGVAEVIRFDEEENATILSDPICCILPYDTLLPAAARVSVNDSDVFPPVEDDAVAGWVFVNLDDPTRPHATQAWMIASMRARALQGAPSGFSVDADVVALGNGCTPPLAGQSEVNDFNNGFTIGPAAN